MADKLHLTFSVAPSDVSDNSYNQWQDKHVSAVLRIDGVQAARRFDMKPRIGTEPPSMFPYLAAYEVDADVDVANQSLRDVRDTNDTPRPAWVSDVRFEAWDCSPLEDQPPVSLTDHMFFVFSAEPPAMPFEAYSDWYHDHLAENVANSPQLLRGWRFRVESLVLDETGENASRLTHLALYELDGEVADMSAGLHQIVDEGGIVLPEWFKEILFVSVEAKAVNERLEDSAQ